MNGSKTRPSCWLYAIPAGILLIGLAISALLFNRARFNKYPALISDAYREPQHRLNVPGSMEVELTRHGAYGIYYETSLLSASAASPSEMPPAIECSLTSKSTGTQIQAVPDFVESNRYWSKDKFGYGVLIMSITVDAPGAYTFSCQRQEHDEIEEIVVALGPNYVWEFLRVAGAIGLPFLGGISALCGSLLVGLIAAVVILIMRHA
jgi:hypothetical protein